MVGRRLLRVAAFPLGRCGAAAMGRQRAAKAYASPRSGRLAAVAPPTRAAAAQGQTAPARAPQRATRPRGAATKEEAQRPRPQQGPSPPLQPPQRLRRAVSPLYHGGAGVKMGSSGEYRRSMTRAEGTYGVMGATMSRSARRQRRHAPLPLAPRPQGPHRRPEETEMDTDGAAAHQRRT